VTCGPVPTSWPRCAPARLVPQALLGYVLEARLAGLNSQALAVAVNSPWDLWWACFRAAIPAGQLDITCQVPALSCPACVNDAGEMAAASPPRHPGVTTGRPCGCRLDWAVRMRTAATPVRWPPLPVTLAVIKPGAPVRALRARLERACRILHARERALTAADVRRLYPEAYGTAFVGAVDAFLTAAPVHVLVLRWRDGHRGQPGEFKLRLRRELGATDVMRNHLHMADNPAEALADIRHLAGHDVLAAVYERHLRDRAADRVAFYRAALGIGTAPADRGAAG
jgi:hypothetical protein